MISFMCLCIQDTRRCPRRVRGYAPHSQMKIPFVETSAVGIGSSIDLLFISQNNETVRMNPALHLGRHIKDTSGTLDSCACNTTFSTIPDYLELGSTNLVCLRALILRFSSIFILGASCHR
jgi:hypothetical protein